ncbi:Homeobox-leucine zipper protein [Vigna angularis]|uniref:Homeobox-leucine zipper protein n=1 Tax=Phaseolus angularis TaxID=3914 RepID=A0A8T0JW92_PHAAN|nr:Homeobox-leucine zipper protein [Vigna angularis]
MEGRNEMGMMGESFDTSNLLGRIRDDDYESRSESDNFDGGSGDEQDVGDDQPQRKKKKYHRHTPQQIQDLEASLSSLASPMSLTPPNSGLDLAIGRNGIGGSSNFGMPVPIGFDLGDGALGSSPAMAMSIKDRWQEMFSSMVASACTLDVLSGGTNGTRNGALQLITWVEHSQYDESVIHQLCRPLVSSGIGFGAQRWIASLLRQCECLAILMTPPGPSDDPTVLSQSNRRSVLKLAQRMNEYFCSGICASSARKWDVLHIGSLADDMKIMARKIVDDPNEVPGYVLSASTCVWLPVPRQRVFDFLRNEQLRGEWDMLSKGGPMKEMLHVPKGQDHGNCVSILHNDNPSAKFTLESVQTINSLLSCTIQKVKEALGVS